MEKKAEMEVHIDETSALPKTTDSPAFQEVQTRCDQTKSNWAELEKKVDSLQFKFAEAISNWQTLRSKGPSIVITVIIFSSGCIRVFRKP